MNLRIIVWIVCLTVISNLGCRAAEDDTQRLQDIRAMLDSLSQHEPAFQGTVDITVSKLPLDELLKNVARLNEVNLSVKDAGNLMVSCNFTQARVDELIYFLCKEYNLDISVIGNIVSIFPHIPPKEKPIVPSVSYQAADSTLSYDILAAPLIEVSKLISQQAGINLIVPQSLYNKSVSGYVTRMPLEEALYTLASVNALELTGNPKAKSWSFETGAPAPTESPGPRSHYTRRRQFTPSQLLIDSTGLISATIDRGNIYDIVVDVCSQLGLDYFFIKPVSAQTSIYLKRVSPKRLFSVLFTGTAYSFYEEGGVYVFGEAKDKNLFTTQVIPLRYRTVDKLVEIIPGNLKEGLQVAMFPDLNSIIASGDQRQVNRIEQFLQLIDHPVPLITIDILIVDATTKRIDEAGVEMGIGEAPTTTAGSFSPGVNLNLGAGSLNNLINSFNGFGVVRLGKVSPNFYMNLQFLEETGHIVLQSTPKLSTLNGHEATLKSGETMYYKEVQNSYMGTQNPVQNSSYTWKNVEANLTVKIVPFVSEDRQITLEIEIEQSEFTERIEKDAPPGLSTRSFKSLVKVGNEEMVLLGGIERNSREKSSSGLPLIARIPILKWLFGKSSDNKTEQKLNVFIKPTVID